MEAKYLQAEHRLGKDIASMWWKTPLTQPKWYKDLRKIQEENPGFSQLAIGG